MDFFQPYKHLTYSVGVIYGVLNLRRSIRYKCENVILIGVIPGPEEPKHDINSFLEPMVNPLSAATIYIWSTRYYSISRRPYIYGRS